MKNSQEIVNDVDFLSQLLTSNPYAAKGQSVLAGLKLTSLQIIFVRKLYIEPF